MLGHQRLSTIGYSNAPIRDPAPERDGRSFHATEDNNCINSTGSLRGFKEARLIRPPALLCTN